jgi:hypothetical protein
MSVDERRPELLCISTYEKGQAFLREAARLGCAVTLLTVEKLQHGDWPWEALAGFHVMPEGLAAEQALPYITRLMVRTKFERIVALDEFDLETAARVGGAYIAEVAEAGSGVNPWVEWARIECAVMRGESYRLPTLREEYAGSVICLARQAEPDTSAYDAAEVVYRMHKHHHAGLIVRSGDAARVEALVGEYGARFLDDFCARMDAPDKPTS